MKITYDPAGDVLAIELRNPEKCAPKYGGHISPGIVALRNDDQELVGIEILDARKRVDGDPASVTLHVFATDEPGSGQPTFQITVPAAAPA